MITPFGSPYRAPAGGWPSPRRYLLGSFWQHRKDSENGIASTINTTRVTDVADPPDEAGIKPYGRLWNGTTAGWPSCAPGSGTGGCLEGIDVPPCAPWTTGDIISADEIDLNAYDADIANPRNFSLCRKMGFKNVQSNRVWHGTFGFTSKDRPGCLTCDDAAQNTPDQTKYLTKSVVVEESGTWHEETRDADDLPIEGIPDVDSTLTGSGNRTYSIESTSGKYSVDGIDSESLEITPSGNPFGLWLWGSNADDLAHIEDAFGMSGGCGVISVHESSRDGGSVWTDLAGKTPAEAITDLEDGSYENQAYNAQSSPTLYERLTKTATVTISNTEVVFDINHDYEMELISYEGDGVTISGYTRKSGTVDFSVTVTLSDANNASTLQTDCEYLLSLYPLNDDVLYPWRTDGFVSVAPLVTRDESPTPISPESINFETETEDPSTYTGDVVGAPLTRGHGPHFSFYHNNWRACDTGSGLAFYKYAQGAWSGFSTDTPPVSPDPHMEATDGQIPRSATQWTENYSDSMTPPGSLTQGAWMICDAVQLRCQKWAETRVPRPSHNYARPCGEDRERFDETTVGCIHSSTAGTVTVGEDKGIETGDTVYVCNDANNEDGFYTVVKSSLTYTLTPKANWTGVSSVIENCGEGIIGKIRWPDAPPICGRIAITSATQDGSDVDLVLADACQQLRVGDLVTFTDVGGLGTGVAISATTDGTHFTVAGTLSGAYTGGGYIASTGAANYKWNDSGWKGDYLYVDWTRLSRDLLERDRRIACGDTIAEIRQTQVDNDMPRDVIAHTVTQKDCEWLPCNPYVMCISPNGETWEHGETTDFPTLVIDGLYGNSSWIGVFVQHLDDPLWQAPHATCEEGDPPTMTTDWTEGTDYQHRPMVEARATLPTSAPALPADATWDGTVATFTAIQSGAVTGLVLAPPVSLGYNKALLTEATPVEHSTPWGLYLAQEAIVCADGTFADDYIEQGVRCP